ncbi:hypothetical protein GCM10009020_29510 [Natronoarchaeum mannanilyticum]|uniref:Uncharacterized protein n=1 Tax=Natronoarchaeum mannanilyticum TaxID=926360 RepID=A0AAV3TDV7_9EURY
MDESLSSGCQAVVLEDGDLLVDEVPHLHASKRSETIDDRIADASYVLFECLIPGVAIDSFEIDSFGEFPSVLIEIVKVLWLVIESFLRELKFDVILDALAKILNDVFETLAFFLVKLGLPLGERIACHGR